MLLTPRSRTRGAQGARPVSRPRRARAALLASAVSVCLLAASAPPPAEPLGVGDRLFPDLGNPGYDVTSYDLAFTYSGDNRKPLSAVTTVVARTTSRLERVNLDFAHGEVESVRVDDAPATFASAREDLVVTPEEPLDEGSTVRITVRHTSDPVSAGREGGWLRTRDGLVMAGQADAAHRVFPCNDHPSDKAMFTFRITAPAGYRAVANGLPAGEGHTTRSTTWTYRTEHPMATELAQIAIGRSAVLHRSGPHGLPVRDVVPRKDRGTLERWLGKTPGHIAWMEGKVGRYPFETYGLLVADAKTGFELETQTLSLFERQLFTRREFPEWYVDSVMVHELAHQWFGNSVSPRTWSDLWISEGHATWYEALYTEEKGGRTLEERMRLAYAASDGWRAAGGPPAAPKAAEPGRKSAIFRPNVYDGAALALYALRQEIGRSAFERLQRAWVSLHRDGTAGTDDFRELASAMAGRDLDGFFRAWLYGERTPPMPGHPDWKPAPQTKPAPEGGPEPETRPAAPGRSGAE
ncbi:zinc metalloprotease [Streptomyces ruber]|uniref:Aminopeptidase N n=2 Tax=Streptomyces TaxID=1883 RepID=A0A918ENK6_9ACTN|nr:M1 family metallopeptidase [Streptomyces ruber]GGQ43745.1 zinc metalloprotease [Streptomyces ruber]